jgi:hypothetical protein
MDSYLIMEKFSGLVGWVQGSMVMVEQLTDIIREELVEQTILVVVSIITNKFNSIRLLKGVEVRDF